MNDTGRGGWPGRLKYGLAKSSQKITAGIGNLFTKRKLDAATMGQLEELLISGDLGVATTAKLIRALAENRFNQEVSSDEVRGLLADFVAAVTKELCSMEKANELCAGNVATWMMNNESTWEHAYEHIKEQVAKEG